MSVIRSPIFAVRVYGYAIDNIIGGFERIHQQRRDTADIAPFSGLRWMRVRRTNSVVGRANYFPLLLAIFEYETNATSNKFFAFRISLSFGFIAASRPSRTCRTLSGSYYNIDGDEKTTYSRVFPFCCSYISKKLFVFRMIKKKKSLSSSVFSDYAFSVSIELKVKILSNLC